jgi:hypothetical protein
MVPEPVGAGGEVPCTLRCVSEREECVRGESGEDTAFPCYCCVPCNISWLVCLADECMLADGYGAIQRSRPHGNLIRRMRGRHDPGVP